MNAKTMAFLATSDAPRARQFFEQTLGLRFLGDEPFALVFDSWGTMLRISKVDQVSPAPYTVLGWEVDDIHAEVRGLAAAGVAFERFGGISQDELGIASFPGGAQVAWFKDPDGNLLSLTQFQQS